MALELDSRTPTEPPAENWERHQGGVPTMSFNGEPLFGQDRFNQFFWRLRQNGLTMRKRPREPLVSRLLRWPLASGLE